MTNYNDMEKLVLCFTEDCDVINTIYTLSFDNKHYFANISRYADCDMLNLEITAKPYQSENPKINSTMPSYVLKNVLKDFVEPNHFLYKFMKDEYDNTIINDTYENFKNILDTSNNDLLKAIMLRGVLENSLQVPDVKIKRTKI